MRYLVHLKNILLHKYYVFFACLKLKVPLYLAIFHDISKFKLSEFIPYAKYYYNKDGSHADVKDKHGELEYTKEANNIKVAWLYHSHTNRHHWNYWITIRSDGLIYPNIIPDKYIKEMVADWIGASKAYNLNIKVIDWYNKEKENLILHQDTRTKIEKILQILEYNGNNRN